MPSAQILEKNNYNTALPEREYIEENEKNSNRGLQEVI
jgi:hypothetical protein